MTAHRWLGVSIVLGVAVAAFTSCKGSTSSGAGGAGGATTSTGGSGGATTGTGGQKVDAGPIVCTADYANVAKDGPCSLINQDCPAGNTCVPASSSKGVSTGCQPSTGLKTADEECYSGNECDAKLICVGLTPTHPGKCLAFCCPDATNAPCNGGICNLRVDFGSGTYAYACSYGKRCQLLAPAACPPGYDCHVESAAGQGVAVCLAPSPSVAPELGSCNYINDCATMQDCYGLGNAGSVCLYYCSLMGPTMSNAPGLGGCPTGETCQSSYLGQPINTGFDSVGLCIPTGGIVPDAGAGDAGQGDAGSKDGGADAATDAGAGDAGAGDAGAGDAGIKDAGADG